MKKVDIFTDGACSGNPGPGGWGAILRYNNHEKVISGGESNTTNNRMELMAFICAMKLLREPCEVTLYSDSKYLCDSISQNWIYNWQKNNWKKSNKKPVLNTDLWEEIILLLKVHKLNIIWVKGHAGHPENERCDQLATSEISKLN